MKMGHYPRVGDKKEALLLERIQRLEEAIVNASASAIGFCPFCGKDTRPRFKCASCDEQHMSRTCHRDGAHADGCIWVELTEKLKDRSGCKGIPDREEVVG